MEMPEDDQPPQRIWLDQDAVNDHFEKLAEKYRSKASGTEIPEDGALHENELTRGLRG